MSVEREFENYIRNRFDFKQFYDEYLIQKTNKERVDYAKQYIAKKAIQYHKKVSKQTRDIVASNIVEYMECIMDKLEIQGKL